MKKRRTNLAAFGVLLGSLIALYGCNDLKNPLILIGEKERVVGKVIEVFPSKEVKTYSRRIKYVYTVNGESFIDFQKLGTQDKRQVIGNSLLVSYSTKNPKNNKLEKLNSEQRSLNVLKFYSVKGKGYIDMRLMNGIFKYKEYAIKGKLVSNLIGEYNIENDTLHLSHFNFKGDSIVSQKPQFFVAHPENGNQIIEIPQNRTFTKINTKRR